MNVRLGQRNMLRRLVKLALAGSTRHERHRRISTRLLGEIHGCGRTPVPCVVQNLSFGGARIVPESAVYNVPTLALSIPQFGFSMPVTMAWKRAGHCGLAFAYDKPDVPLAERRNEGRPSVPSILRTLSFLAEGDNPGVGVFPVGP